MKKFLLVILDGAADKKSAFAKARKPHMDMLAANSCCGLWSGPYAPRADGRKTNGRRSRHAPLRHFAFNPRSMSSVATLEILGYSWRDEPGRGYLEALGALKTVKNSVYVRGNFAFVRKAKIVDRRAGRDEAGLDVLVRDINKKIAAINGIKVKVRRLFGHRVVVVLTGRGLDRHVSDADMGPAVKKIRPLSSKARKTADVLNEFAKRSHALLSPHPANKKRKVPANFILLRSAGSYQKAESFRKKYGLHACSVSGVNIIRGTSMYLGIDVIDAPLSQLEDDLHARAEKAVDALEKYDFVVLHINGADTYAHNKDFSGKVRYIEKIDREVFSQLLRLRSVSIAVISDHITNSRSGEHVFGPVPFLVYSPDEDGDGTARFDEKSCRSFVTDSPMKKILGVVRCT